jgi:hypothetical protein
MAADRLPALARGLALAALWLSPPALLGAAAAILADGTRGLAVPLGLAGGAALAALLLPRGAGWRGEDPVGTGALLRRRWPARAGWSLAVLGASEAAASILVAWAQLAATREVGETLGLPAGARPGLVLAIAGLGAALALVPPARRRATVAGVAGGLGVAGWMAPLAAVLVVTVPWWPRVWSEVASRPRVTFPGGSAWTTEGRPVGGPWATPATITFTEEHRVVLLGRGRVEVRYWGGGEGSHEVAGRADVQLRAGDRLTVAPGLRIRFQPDRRIPGAPASGPDWLDPRDGRAAWPALVGLALTLGLGAVGCPGALGLVASGGATAARLGGLLAVGGAAAATLWALYALWLTPEVYLGGVSGAGVFGLPAGARALGRPTGDVLRLAAGVGMLAGAACVVAAAVRGVGGAGAGGGRARPLAGLGLAAALATGMPAPSWPVLLAGLGLAASTLAPASLLSTWSEGITPRGLGLGTVAGLGLHASLLLLALAAGVAPGQQGSGAWSTWLLAWPVALALPVNLLLAWRGGRRRPARRGELAPELEALHR